MILIQYKIIVTLLFGFECSAFTIPFSTYYSDMFYHSPKLESQFTCVSCTHPVFRNLLNNWDIYETIYEIFEMKEMMYLKLGWCHLHVANLSTANCQWFWEVSCSDLFIPVVVVINKRPVLLRITTQLFVLKYSCKTG